jgi:hypothetical protein
MKISKMPLRRRDCCGDPEFHSKGRVPRHCLILFLVIVFAFLLEPYSVYVNTIGIFFIYN